jgi:hypothetical protein
MKLTRRAFFQGLVASVATVAIALRMAPKFLPDSLLNTGTWRYEQATDKYFYGVDLAKPWEIQIFEQTDFHDPESWKLMDAKDLMQRAYESLVKTEKKIQVGPRKDKPDRLFVCAEDEQWPWNNVSEISHETLVEVGVDPDMEEAMEAASIIAMSQGFAALQVEGGPHIINGDYGFGIKGYARLDDRVRTYDPIFETAEMEADVFAVPTIHTTKEELFRHG